MADDVIDPLNLVGTWRRFGPVGPVYQIVGLGAQASDGDRWVKVRVLETGEEAEYKLHDLLEDPVEA